MKVCQAADVVLIAFPFSGGEGIKKRPALVLLDTGDEDVIVARITTQEPQSNYDARIIQWQEAGLLAPSVVRTTKIATLSKSLINRRLGKLMAEDWNNIKSNFQKLWQNF